MLESLLWTNNIALVTNNTTHLNLTKSTRSGDMSRIKANLPVIILLCIIWLVPIYALFRYYRENIELRDLDSSLKRTEDSLRSKLLSLEEQTFPRVDYAKLRRDEDFQVSETKQINIFVEMSNNPKKQFYRTSSLNRDLFNHVRRLPQSEVKRILITGGAGFIGSHLTDSLMLEGHEVIVCDNFFTGRKSNIEHWLGHPSFELMHHDVIEPLTIEVNEIYHLASPASPIHYMSNPIKTIKTNTVGTINMLGLAKRVDARILIASTSEIYGDPEVHPQQEDYWGHTNPIGPRSCYDESKRLSETLAVAYRSRENVSVTIARIFNTYGPRMHPNDGRVVSNFLTQAIGNKKLTVYGSGDQTRSFQYVSDLVNGLKKLMESNVASPVNLGNPDEMTIKNLSIAVKNLFPTNYTNGIVHMNLPIDDPHRRRPDIRKAKKLLDWSPKVPLSEGLNRTYQYFLQEASLYRVLIKG